MTTSETPPEESPLLSDVGNAQRLVRLFGTEVKYCFPWKKWIIWTGKKWEKDNKGQIVQRAKHTVRSLYHEAGNIENDGERRRVAAHALKSESCSKIKGIIELACDEPTIPILPADLDSNSWILPVCNGTIDLTSGKSRPHNKEDYNTKIVDIDFDPDAKCPMWLAFLDQMMNHNQELIDFLQKAVGYSLTGSTREQCIFILYGVGSNGKSTFLEVVSKVVGDYGTRIPPESLLSKKNDGGVNNDIARLAGARLVASAEGDEGKSLAESLVKQITGGETITARFLHQEFFDFKPQFKLFYATNHKPNIRGSDHAIWRRIRLIPFTIKIADEDQDKNLESKLSQELPGILNWALEGCLRWQKEGLEIPEEIRTATADYRDEMDTLSEFLETCCVYGNEYSIHNKTLKMAHDSWCELYKEKPMSHIEFSRKIQSKGFDKQKTKSGRNWLGISLKHQLLSMLEVTVYDKVTVLTVFQHLLHERENIGNKVKTPSNRHLFSQNEHTDSGDGLDQNHTDSENPQNPSDLTKNGNVTQSRFENQKDVSNSKLMEKVFSTNDEDGNGSSPGSSQHDRAMICFDIKG